MAENRCLLTEDGRSQLETLLGRAYPESKRPNKSQIQRDTGLSRDTLNRIFNCPYQPVQKRCLENLFEKLNARLGDNAQNIVFDETHYTDSIEERGLQSPNSLSQRDRSKLSPGSQSSRNEPSPTCLQERLDTLLRRLNYTTGQAWFEQSMQQLKPIGAFLIQVSDTNVQRWLVRRLAQQVSGFINAEKLEINVALSGGNFEYIWSQFAEKLKLPDETAEATIASLSELCQGKTVIIVLSRLQQLDGEMQQRLMGEFWFPLVRQICSQRRDWRSRLVLFLVQDGERLEECPNCPFEVVSPKDANNPEYPVLLEPLVQIASCEVQDWFEKEGFELLAARIGREAADQFMQQDQISRWKSHPWTTLENVCNVFQTEISEIEQYWKLAG